MLGENSKHVKIESSDNDSDNNDANDDDEDDDDDDEDDLVLHSVVVYV